MKPEFVGLGLILAGALYLFWTQRLRTDITALLVMLCLAIPWPHSDGKWAGILTPQEAFAGFGKRGRHHGHGNVCFQRGPGPDRRS